MKKRTLLILSVSCFLMVYISKRNHSYANNDPTQKRDNVLEESGKDSCLMAYLEKNDSVEFSWDLVFENATNDTIIMTNIFKDFRGDALVNHGFNAYIYRNRKGVLQIRDEPQIYYYISGLDGAKRNAVFILPQSKAKLPFTLNSFYYLLPEKTEEEIGVQFIVRYGYLNKQSGRFQHITTTTNYLSLNTSDEFEHKPIE